MEGGKKNKKNTDDRQQRKEKGKDPSAGMDVQARSGDEDGSIIIGSPWSDLFHSGLLSIVLIVV